MPSILQLPPQAPTSWATFGRAGESGSFGYTIDCGSVSEYNRLMHRDLIPVSSDVSFQIRVRLVSTLVASSPSYEGLAVRMRGFALTGSAPSTEYIQVWDSAPEGESEWVSEQNPDFTTYNFVISVPPDLGIDYCTLELVARAESGSVIISNVECRYYYGKIHKVVLEGLQRWETAATIMIGVSTGYNSLPTVRSFTSFPLFTTNMVCRKGQNLTFNCSTYIDGVALEIPAAGGIATATNTTRGLMARMRRKERNIYGGGVYDYFDMLNDYTVALNTGVVRSATQIERAQHDYDEWQVYPFVEAHKTSGPANPQNAGAEFIEVENTYADLTISDFGGPSQ